MLTIDHPDFWTAGANPAATGFHQAELGAAICFHQAHETDWPTSMYTPAGDYIGTAAIGDRPEFAAVIGPVRPRGGPNGIVLRHGALAAEWGDTSRPDMTFSVTKSYIALLAAIAIADGLINDIDAPVARDIPGTWFQSRILPASPGVSCCIRPANGRARSGANPTRPTTITGSAARPSSKPTPRAKPANWLNPAVFSNTTTSA